MKDNIEIKIDNIMVGGKNTIGCLRNNSDVGLYMQNKNNDSEFNFVDIYITKSCAQSLYINLGNILKIDNGGI